MGLPESVVSEKPHQCQPFGGQFCPLARLLKKSYLVKRGDHAGAGGLPPQEAKITPFCPSREKFPTFVSGCQKYLRRPLKSPCEISPVNAYLATFSPPDPRQSAPTTGRPPPPPSSTRRRRGGGAARRPAPRRGGRAPTSGGLAAPPGAGKQVATLHGSAGGEPSLNGTTSLNSFQGESGVQEAKNALFCASHEEFHTGV